jgi:DNA (cytosine-5)-methyltransferase 1
MLMDGAFTLIDLFAGAGGLSLGFAKLSGHGYRSVWANDSNKPAIATYAANFGGHAVPGDIMQLLDAPEIDIPVAGVVIGGPPCQGFSLLNKNRRTDERKSLWQPFFDVVRRAQADVFVMENVPQLLASSEYEDILDAACQLGFTTRAATLCAADYGVAQMRKRAFIVGCRFADPALSFPPKRTHYNPKQQPALYAEEYADNPLPWRTVRDAIADLPEPQGTEVTDAPPPLNLHFGRMPTAMSMARYRAIPEQGMNRFDLQRIAPELTPECWIRKTSGGTDLFGRLWWDRPAFTIRTEFFKPEKGRYLHPSQHRPLTHREAARLQSFPDDFRFCGSKIEIAKQIGNAVPPLLAACVADSVTALLRLR